MGLVDGDEVGDNEHETIEQSSSRQVGSSSAAHPNPIPKVLIALLLLSQATTGEAVREEQVVLHGSGVSVDYSLVTWMVIWLLALAC